MIIGANGAGRQRRKKALFWAAKLRQTGAGGVEQLLCRTGVKLGEGFRYSRPPKPLLSPEVADLEGRSQEHANSKDCRNSGFVAWNLFAWRGPGERPANCGRRWLRPRIWIWPGLRVRPGADLLVWLLRLLSVRVRAIWLLRP